MADLLFYAVLLLRLAPVLWQRLPAAVWSAAAVVLLVRLAAYAAASVRYRRFAALHTWLNKLTGAGVFLLPYVLALSTGVVYSWALCVLAFAASLEELTIHLCRKGYCAGTKSLFQKENKQSRQGLPVKTDTAKSESKECEADAYESSF